MLLIVMDLLHLSWLAGKFSTEFFFFSDGKASNGGCFEFVTCCPCQLSTFSWFINVLSEASSVDVHVLIKEFIILFNFFGYYSRAAFISNSIVHGGI